MCEKWTRQPLGDLLTLEYGASLPEAIRKPGTVPVYGSNGQVGYHSVSVCQGPGMIVGRKGSVGQVCWSQENFWPIDTTYYVRPKMDIEIRWLYWLLLNAGLTKLDSSTGVPGLNRNDAYSLMVDCPRPNEQRAIAAILDTMDEVIRRTEAMIAKLRQMKAGMLHDLLTRGLDENGELRDPIRHPEQFKDSPLGRIPNEWNIGSLGSIGLWAGGHTPSKAIKKYWDGGNILWVTPKDVRGKVLVDTQDHLSYQAIKETSLSVFPPGSIIVVFRSGILRHSVPIATCEKPFTVNQDMKVLIPNQEVIPEFIGLLTEDKAKLILNVAVKSGTTVESIDRSMFESIPIALPNDKEQKEIVCRITSLSEKLDGEIKNKQKLISIKSGLMQDLLSGHVRVPESMIQKYQTASEVK